MTWREVERDLEKLAADERALAQDTVRTIGRQAERAGEEFVAAEYVATGGVLEWIVGWAEDGREGLGIAGRQWRLLFDDHLTTLSELVAARTGADLMAIPSGHLRRRITHLRAGVDDSRSLFDRGVRRSLAPLTGAWQPLLTMFRDDWRR